MEKEQEYLPYKILAEGGSAEIVEKKSRFIATLMPVQTEEEAAAFITGIKKKYWDARHNCSAFVIGEKGELTRCSDDGEPGGTAGKPMLETLLGAGLRNAAAVVTRYFGGTLLGTGGLVRAYTQAVQAGLRASVIETMHYGAEWAVATDYNGMGKINYILGQAGIAAEEISYAEDVRMKLLIPYEIEERLRREMTEATNGKVRIQVADRYYFPAGRCLQSF